MHSTEFIKGQSTFENASESEVPVMTTSHATYLVTTDQHKQCWAGIWQQIWVYLIREDQVHEKLEQTTTIMVHYITTPELQRDGAVYSLKSWQFAARSDLWSSKLLHSTSSLLCSQGPLLILCPLNSVQTLTSYFSD